MKNISMHFRSMYGISRLATYYPFRIISTFPVLKNLKELNFSYSVARYVICNIVFHSNSDLHNERMFLKFLSLILFSNVCDIGKEVNGNILLSNSIHCYYVIHILVTSNSNFEALYSSNANNKSWTGKCFGRCFERIRHVVFHAR